MATGNPIRGDPWSCNEANLPRDTDAYASINVNHTPISDFTNTSQGMPSHCGLGPTPGDQGGSEALLIFQYV